MSRIKYTENLNTSLVILANFTRRLVILLLISTLGLILSKSLLAADKANGSPQAESEDFPYIAISKGMIDVESGIIKLAASRDGVIKNVLIEDGDVVKAGDILAIQDDRNAGLALAVARAELSELKAALRRLRVREQAAKREQTRLTPLMAEQAVAGRDLDEITDQIKLIKAETDETLAAITTAQARVNAAEYEVERHKIRAPRDGRIVRLLTQPGDAASTLEVTPLFWFVPDAPRVVRAELEEQYAGLIEPGMQAEFVPVHNEARRYTAVVDRIGYVLGPKRTTVYDPRERTDVHRLECILRLESDSSDLVLGQRVIVKIIRPQQAALSVEGGSL